MAGCERFGGCRRRRARAFHSCRARTTSALCTKNSLDPPQTESVSVTLLTGTFFAFCQALTTGPRDFLLPPDHHDDEGAGLHLAAAFAGSRWIEVGGGEKDVMGLEVQAHGTRASFGRNIFDNREFVRRIFVDDRKVAIAAGSERVTRRGLKSAGIRAFAAGRGGHDLAG